MDSAPYYYYRRQRQKKEFLLPFLIIIFIAIILILLIQLLLTLTSSKEQSLDTKIKVFKYSDNSNIQILPATQTTWINGYNGNLLVEGDSIKTGNTSKAILIFNDGNLLRMDENTQITINQLDSDDTGIKSLLELAYGSVWMNKSSADGDYVFKTQNANIYSVGTIFAIEDKSLETLRVIEGNVQFDVIDKDQNNVVLDNYVVGIGQQLLLNDSALEKLKQRKSVDLIEAVSNDWESTDWYKWNIKEDKSPTAYEALLEGKTVDQTNMQQVTDEAQQDSQDDNSTNNTEAPVSQPLAVYVSKPAKSPVTITAEQYMISGTVKGTAKSIVVDSVNGKGVRDVYTLGKFKQGDSTWSYNASKSFNNLTEGTNKYTIYGKAPDGSSSDKITIEIIVPAGTYKVEEATSTEMQTEASTITLSISSFNGTPNTNNSYETTEERVEVIGAVSTEAIKVVVNGFALGEYVAGSGVFKYFAKTEFNNLNPGTNTFTAYGVDGSGKKSSAITFTIVKK